MPAIHRDLDALDGDRTGPGAAIQLHRRSFFEHPRAHEEVREAGGCHQRADFEVLDTLFDGHLLIVFVDVAVCPHLIAIKAIVDGFDAV